jgi:hypothetical protein
MLYFQVSQARFMVSAEDFMKVLSLTCDVVRTYEHTIESTWRHVKPSLNPYNRNWDCVYHQAHYTFVAECRSENVDQFTKFIGIAATKD